VVWESQPEIRLLLWKKRWNLRRYAVGFVFVASSSLLFLFCFKIYKIVKVMYSFGCSNAVSQVLFDPLAKMAMKKWESTIRVAHG
jgi:hypothetical protein